MHPSNMVVSVTSLYISMAVLRQIAQQAVKMRDTCMQMWPRGAYASLGSGLCGLPSSSATCPAAAGSGSSGLPTAASAAASGATAPGELTSTADGVPPPASPAAAPDAAAASPSAASAGAAGCSWLSAADSSGPAVAAAAAAAASPSPTSAAAGSAAGTSCSCWSAACCVPLPASQASMRRCSSVCGTSWSFVSGARLQAEGTEDDSSWIAGSKLRCQSAPPPFPPALYPSILLPAQPCLPCLLHSPPEGVGLAGQQVALNGGAVNGHAAVWQDDRVLCRSQRAWQGQGLRAAACIARQGKHGSIRQHEPLLIAVVSRKHTSIQQQHAHPPTHPPTCMSVIRMGSKNSSGASARSGPPLPPAAPLLPASPLPPARLSTTASMALRSCCSWRSMRRRCSRGDRPCSSTAAASPDSGSAWCSCTGGGTRPGWHAGN